MDNKINELPKVSGYNKWIAVAVVAIAALLSFFAIKENGLSSNNATSVSVVYDSLNQEQHQIPDTCKFAPSGSDKKLSHSSDSTNSKSPAITSITSITANKISYTTAILLYCCILVFIAVSLSGSFIILLKVLKFEHDMKSKILDVQKEIYKEKQMWKLANEKKQQEFEDKKQELDLNKKAWNELEKERAIFKYEHERAPESIKGSKEQKKNP